MALGLQALNTPIQPCQRRRLNMPSTDASSRSCVSGCLSISSACHTPISESDQMLCLLFDDYMTPKPLPCHILPMDN